MDSVILLIGSDFKMCMYVFTCVKPQKIIPITLFMSVNYNYAMIVSYVGWLVDVEVRAKRLASS